MLLFLLLAMTIMVGASEERPVEVQLKLGSILGKEETFLDGKKVQSFLSVPFAEKPIGKDRFKPPKVKKPWNGILNTTTLSPACYQGRDTFKSNETHTFWGVDMWNANTEVSEDCLYLNIWAPAGAYNLSVMVWLFGGGFWYGSPSLSLYDGRAMALTGNVIVVNVNYRVGAFGFLYYGHDDVPGNMGMLDQQLALYWIKDNIFNFGGNPSRVTLFGESAGASSIVAHMIAPASRELFSNGILQSGALDNKWAMDSPEHAMNKSLQLAQRLNCTRHKIEDTIDCMVNTDAQYFPDEYWKMSLEFLEFPFVIVSQDKNFFKQKDAFKALREGDFRDDVNIMIGLNADEGNFWNIYNLNKYFGVDEQPELTLDEFHNCIEEAFKTQPTLVRNAAKYVYYDSNCTSGKTKFYAKQVNQMVGDYFFTCDSLWMADKLTEKRNGNKNSGKVYIYYFNQTSQVGNPWPDWTGVMHGYEIEFVFGSPIANLTHNYPEREMHFSNKVIQYWTSFATNGVPSLFGGTKQNEVWPVYDGINNRKWLHLRAGSHIKTEDAKKRIECDLWRNAKDIEYKAYVASLKTSSTSLTTVSLHTVLLYSIVLLIR